MNEKSELPLYLQIEKHLLEAIASESFREGELIPTEKELAQKYGVSPGTVRRAALNLKQRGFLHRTQGRGTFVVFQETNMRRLRHYRFVERLQRSPNLVNLTIVLLSLKVLPATEDIADYLQIRKGAKVIRLERMGKLSNESFLHILSYLPKKLYAGLERYGPDQFVKNTLWKIQESYFNHRIDKKEEFITVEMANQEVARALEIKPGDPVLRIEALVTSTDGNLIEYRVSRCNQGGMRFYVNQDGWH